MQFKHIQKLEMKDSSFPVTHKAEFHIFSITQGKVSVLVIVNNRQLQIPLSPTPSKCHILIIPLD